MIYSYLFVAAAVIVAIIFFNLINNDFHHEEKVVIPPDNIFVPQSPSIIIEPNPDINEIVEITSEKGKSFTIGEIVSAGEKPTKIPKKPKDWRKKKLKEDVTLKLK